MRELYNYMDYKSRDAAENIRIAFDESAWEKMKVMLDKDDENPITPVILNTTIAVTSANQNYKWLLLVMLPLFIGIGLLFNKNNQPQKSKTKSPLINKKVFNKSQDSVAEIYINREQIEKKHLNQQQSAIYNYTNRNFRHEATIVRKSSLSLIQNINYNNGKKEVELQNIKDGLESINKENGAMTDNIGPDQSKEGVKQVIGSNQQHMNITLGLNKQDSKKRITVNKTRKNKFFKNVGFSGFIFPEINSVKFKSTDRSTIGYGAGINYTIGKHFTLQAQFAKTRKVYVADKKGYNPVAGSWLSSIDTLEVNGDCKVWDIPVNLRYNFKSNIKNDFFISAGLSSYVMKKEIYDFDYYYQGIYGKKRRIIENENKHYFCNLNFSVGYQYWLNKKWSIGFEPYLKLPLTGVGAGKVKLTSAGALFNLTFKPMK